MRTIESYAREKLLTIVSPRGNKPRRPIIGGLQTLKNCYRIKPNSKLAPTTLKIILNTLNKT